MKRKRAIALLVALFAFTVSSFATTCISGKKFKTRKVCGTVRDVSGAEIPDAIIQLEKPDTQEVISKSQSHLDGSFRLENLAPGDYVIRVKVRAFVDASQIFRLVRVDKGEGCRRAIRVVMDVAGRCSAVQNAWNK